MYKNNYREPFLKRLFPYLGCAVVFILVLCLVVSGLLDTKKAAHEEGVRIAEESIRKAAVSCYAMEGSYPQDYEYLKRYYGISIDENQYIVHYEVFASNIMPVISVSKVERLMPL